MWIFTWKFFFLLQMVGLWMRVLSLGKSELVPKQFLARNEETGVCTEVPSCEVPNANEWKFFVAISFGTFCPFTSGALVKTNMVLTNGRYFLTDIRNRLEKCYGKIHVALHPMSLSDTHYKFLRKSNITDKDCAFPAIALFPEQELPSINGSKNLVEVVEVFRYPSFKVAFVIDPPRSKYKDHLSHGLVLLKTSMHFAQTDTIQLSYLKAHQTTTCSFIYWNIAQKNICQYKTELIQNGTSTSDKIRDFFINEKKVNREAVDEYMGSKMYSIQVKRYLGSGYPIVCSGLLQGIHDLSIESIKYYVHEDINKFTNINIWLNTPNPRKETTTTTTTTTTTKRTTTTTTTTTTTRPWLNKIRARGAFAATSHLTSNSINIVITSLFLYQING